MHEESHRFRSMIRRKATFGFLGQFPAEYLIIKPDQLGCVWSLQKEGIVTKEIHITVQR